MDGMGLEKNRKRRKNGRNYRQLLRDIHEIDSRIGKKQKGVRMVQWNMALFGDQQLIF